MKPSELIEAADRAPRNEREYRLHCMVADLLRLCQAPGVYWSTVPMGELRTKKTAARIKRLGARPGFGDIFVQVGGQAYMLELKVPPNKQTENQISTERDFTGAGGIYRVANSFDEAKEILTAWGAIRPDRSVRPATQTRAYVEWAA